jgi:hypothetical protein
MNEPVIPRAAIAEDANLAAQRAVAHGVEQANPHPQDSEAHAIWRAAYLRFMLLHSAPEGCEGVA